MMLDLFLLNELFRRHLMSTEQALPTWERRGRRWDMPTYGFSKRSVSETAWPVAAPAAISDAAASCGSHQSTDECVRARPHFVPTAT